jgi:hypothetical protein
MLAFAHIPTGTTASKGIDIDDSESGLVAPAVAATRSKSAGLHRKERLRLSHDRGPPQATSASSKVELATWLQ